jgi:dipeptidyl aminopeptidase/acylaminoacyl peptidase
VLDLASGKLEQINPSDKKIAYGTAAFARAGRVVYYTSDENAEFKRLVAHDLGNGKKEVLTPGIDWDIEQLAVSRDGRWLAFMANEEGASALYWLKTAHGAKPQRIDVPAGIVAGLKFDRQSRRLGFTLSSPSGMDVWAIDVGKTKPVRWTQSEIGGLSAPTFVTPELVRFPSFDGKKIPAWYYRPKNANGPVPVVIEIHGGPEGQSRPGFAPTVQYWVNELGLAVLLPNVRGSTGYGKTYVTLDNAEKREDSVKDIGALLDWIATRPELDRARVAVFGGSYGGYMVLASLVHFSDRLRCGVEIVGISNFVTFLRSTKGYRVDLRRVEYGDERDPKMRAILEKISPLTNASRIKVPLFVAQGKNDPRVPVTEAEQIVKTVRQGGGPVWYMLAKDEGHGFQKRTNRDAFLNATALFFETFLR